MVVLAILLMISRLHSPDSRLPMIHLNPTPTAPPGLFGWVGRCWNCNQELRRFTATENPPGELVCHCGMAHETQVTRETIVVVAEQPFDGVTR